MSGLEVVLLVLGAGAIGFLVGVALSERRLRQALLARRFHELPGFGELVARRAKDVAGGWERMQ